MRARVLLVLINLLSFGCLVWTLRDARLGDLRDDLATMDWKWVALAVIADIAVYLCHGLRWSLLLRPVEPVGFWRTVRAIYIGLFANEVLPFRAGEVLRCYLLSIWTELPFSVALSSAVIERIFDGLCLSLCLFLTLHFVPLPKQFHYLTDGAWVLGLVVLGGAVLLGIAMFLRGQNGGQPVPLPARGWRRHLSVLLKDLGLIGHSRYLSLAFLQSLPYLLLQVIPIWAAFKGYGFDLGLTEAFALMVFLRLGSVVPQAPGNLGLFQFLTKEVLEKVFNVVPDESARFSLVLWGVVTLPLLIGGFIALWIEEADIIELKRAAEQEAATLRSPTLRDR
jgi:glycosyltransferase 2 family protein